MTPLLWIIGGIGVLVVIVIALSLCRAAAIGDEMVERWTQEERLRAQASREDETTAYPYDGPGAK